MFWHRGFVVATAAFCVSAGCSKEAPFVESPAPAATPSATSKPGDSADEGDAGKTTSKPPAEKSVYHFIGRFDTRDPDGPRFAWPATQIRTRFSGTGATAKLRATAHFTETDRLDVSIDGAKPTVLKPTPGVGTYTVASGLADGEHDLVLTKRTEPLVGTLQLLSVQSAEKRPLIATAPRQHHLIEFIGDSITCGFGVLGKSPCTFTADTESELSSYSGLTSSLLGAEHATLCWSGMGIYRNNLNDTEDQMPTRYERALPDDPASVWNFSYTPDVVVVNLGTNDFGQGNPGTPYRDTMATFAATLRAKYPNAYVVLSVSSMMSGAGRTSMRTFLKDVVSTRTGAGDTKIGFFEFDEQLPTDGLGCEGHPSLTTQQKSADKLAKHLRSLTGW